MTKTNNKKAGILINFALFLMLNKCSGGKPSFLNLKAIIFFPER